MFIISDPLIFWKAKDGALSLAILPEDSRNSSHYFAAVLIIFHIADTRISLSIVGLSKFSFNASAVRYLKKFAINQGKAVILVENFSSHRVTSPG